MTFADRQLTETQKHIVTASIIVWIAVDSKLDITTLTTFGRFGMQITAWLEYCVFYLPLIFATTLENIGHRY